MKKHYLKYGEKTFEINLSEKNVLQELHSKQVSPISNLEKELNNLLDNPIDSKPFNEIFMKNDKIVIVVSDITRLWLQTIKFLPIVVKRLNNIGISDKNITILIANGTHRTQTDEELIKIVSKDLFERLEIVEHSSNTSTIVLGKTSRNTEVSINKLLLDRKVILTGGIVHHLMAGFGGGRKSILPGVVSKKTIFQNHLHALDPKNDRSNPLIGVGVTKENPINLDMIEAAQMINPDFLINSIVDTKGNILKLAVGNWLSAWEQGCNWANEIFGVPINEKADLVITSCGGYPKDISLYQSTKSLFNAALAVKPGGTILLFAECRDGAGADTFFNWINPLKENKLYEELKSNFTIAGYIFYAAVEIAKKLNIILVSSIKPELVKPMGIKSTNNIDEALSLAGIHDKDKKVIVMPYGGNTIPLYKK
ncbi:nickel-dependent lactate racemase [Clostridium aestuarii]|uniref:Nickel-dependent lactate racemase n=1 Tax=Clostridium aestuarii TaxID=338193 RepID=A0ABT4D3E9_9CLOT|nr:nickel-dependent lactate racemase [Clostridium aestuarii]MCY6484568.1 nickel-dependent lactate racemase [Clostridium aestuarii]